LIQPLYFSSPITLFLPILAEYSFFDAVDINFSTPIIISHATSWLFHRHDYCHFISLIIIGHAASLPFDIAAVTDYATRLLNIACSPLSISFIITFGLSTAHCFFAILRFFFFRH